MSQGVFSSGELWLVEAVVFWFGAFGLGSVRLGLVRRSWFGSVRSGAVR